MNKNEQNLTEFEEVPDIQSATDKKPVPDKKSESLVKVESKPKKESKPVPEQKSKELVNKSTGLTPKQEECATLLASGQRVVDVAEQLSISRTTIYQWLTYIPFKRFYTALCAEIKNHLNVSIFSMCDDALKAIKEALASSDDVVKFKTATWVLERVEKVNLLKGVESFDKTDTIEEIKKKSFVRDDFHPNGKSFSSMVFSRYLKKYGITLSKEEWERYTLNEDD